MRRSLCLRRQNIPTPLCHGGTSDRSRSLVCTDGRDENLLVSGAFVTRSTRVCFVPVMCKKRPFSRAGKSANGCCKGPAMTVAKKPSSSIDCMTASSQPSYTPYVCLRVVKCSREFPGDLIGHVTDFQEPLFLLTSRHWHTWRYEIYKETVRREFR